MAVFIHYNDVYYDKRNIFYCFLKINCLKDDQNKTSEKELNTLCI